MFSVVLSENLTRYLISASFIVPNNILHRSNSIYLKVSSHKIAECIPDYGSWPTAKLCALELVEYRQQLEIGLFLEVCCYGLQVIQAHGQIASHQY